MYIDLLVNCDNGQYIKNMIIYNQKGDKIMKYEVAEETGMRLVLNTENAGYIELAEVIEDFIYVYIDDVDYFDNVYQCEEAEQDVLKFVEFWSNKGKKLYNEED